MRTGNIRARRREEEKEEAEPTCQDNNICFLQGSAAVLPDVERVVAAQQPPRHPPKKAGDTQGLHSSPGREGGPSRTEVSRAKATGTPGAKTTILR